MSKIISAASRTQELINYTNAANDLVQLASNTGFYLDIVGKVTTSDVVFKIHWQTNPDKFNKSFTDPVEAINEIHSFLDTLRPYATKVVYKPMLNLAKLLAVIHESVELSSANELREAIKLIIEVQAMDSGMRDCIRAAYLNGPIDDDLNGPIDDGDVPSKSGRDALLDSGYISKVVVKGEQGFNACTYKGASAFKLIEAGA